MAGFFSTQDMKHRMINGILVGVSSALLWFVVSAIHWNAWYAILYRIGWASENQSLLEFLNHLVAFFLMYGGFGLVGGLIGHLVKFYSKK